MLTQSDLVVILVSVEDTSALLFCWSLFPLESYDSEVISLQPSSCVSSPLLFFLLLYQNLEEGYSLSESANQMPSPPPSLGNLSTLDITNDDDLPTDPSNSSDTQEESGCKQTHHVSSLHYLLVRTYNKWKSKFVKQGLKVLGLPWGEKIKRGRFIFFVIQYA